MAITNKFFLSILIFSFLSSVLPASAASFKMSPASAVFSQNCQSGVDILLDTDNGISNAADIKINYDSTKIDVLQIKPGNVYGNYFGNIVDSNSGTIRLTGATFDSTFNGHGVFATIIFKPKVNTGSSSFNIFFTGANPYNSLDSNIADAATSNDLLSIVQNGTYTFNSGNCTADNTPPVVTFISPINNQAGVPADANIVVDTSDPGSGVDINGISFTINGVQYTSNSPQVSFTGSPALYHFIIKPLAPLNTAFANVVSVSASDLSGNSRQKSITFNLPSAALPVVCLTPTVANPLLTSGPSPSPISGLSPTPIPTTSPAPDNQSPQITFISPQAKQTISLRPEIKFSLSDPGSGIDLNSLQLIINGQTIAFADPGITSSGSKFSSNISYQVKNPLKPDTDYNLTVFISDLSGNSLSQSILVHTSVPFTVRLAGFLASVPAYLPLLLLALPLLGLIIYLLHLLYLLNHRFDTPFGQVTDSATLEPIPNFLVKVFNDQNKYLQSTHTNVFGIFSFHLSPGKYQFTAGSSRSDFVIVSADSDIFINLPITPAKAPQDDRLPEPLNQCLTLLGLRLPPHGFVFNPQGHLQPNLTINLLDPRNKTLITSRITNQIGQYRFLVPHGRYLIDIPQAPQAGFIVDTRHLINGYTAINRHLFL